MAKDFFQDIVPPVDNKNGQPKRVTITTRPGHPMHEYEPEGSAHDFDAESHDSSSSATNEQEETPVRGIRNISIQNQSRPRQRIDAGVPVPAVNPAARGIPIRPRRSLSTFLLWAVVLMGIVVLGFLGLYMFRPTSVTVVPLSHAVMFDETSQFIAYPADSAATGTLPYTVVQQDFSDSESVQGSGTTQVESKSSGNVVVYNAYSTQPVHLIKNTRFQTPDGLVFRAPSEITIPGMSGTTPGQATVTLFADQSGSQYNVGPSIKFTLPGLQQNAKMYTSVYAVSAGAMTGGSAGSQTGVSDSVRQSAVSDVRSKLAAKVQSYIAQLNSTTTTAFASLAQITYQDMPDTDQTDTTVLINETAHVSVPVFPAPLFATIVAQTVAADTTNAPLHIVAQNAYSAHYANASSTSMTLGSDSISFQLTGTAQLVWDVDTSALSQALAGRSQGAFETIIGNFSGIQEAHARIEPFWSTTFPSNPARIHIEVDVPALSASSSRS